MQIILKLHYLMQENYLKILKMKKKEKIDEEKKKKKKK